MKGPLKLAVCLVQTVHVHVQMYMPWMNALALLCSTRFNHKGLLKVGCLDGLTTPAYSIKVRKLDSPCLGFVIQPAKLSQA